MAKLNAGNVYDAGVQQTLDPQTVAMIKMLQSPNRTISTPNRQLTVRSDQLAPTVEADRLRRQQTSMDDKQDALQRVGPGLGRWAPAMGGIKAAAQMLQRPIDEAKQEDLYARIVAAEQAKKAEAVQAQADQQAREDAKAEASYKRERADAMADADAAHRRQLEVAAHAAGLKPQQKTKQQVVSEIINNPDLSEDQKREMLVIEAPGLVKDRDAKEAAAQELKSKASAEEAGLESINYLLDMENREALRDATGSLEGSWLGDMKNAGFNQPAVDWRNQFNALGSLATFGNLGKMQGVLSDTDIEILRQVGMNGLDTTSSEDRVVKQLTAMQNYYNAVGDGGDGAGNRSKLMDQDPEDMPSVKPPGIPDDWRLEIDSAGNKAWVSPDRTDFREVQ